jgi:hypothetical protein
MTNVHRARNAAAVVAVLTAGVATPALPQAAAHDHRTAAPRALSLDHGRKWATDVALRDGMGRIRGLVEPRLGDAHGGRLDDGQYRALAVRIEAEVGTIVAKCKLAPAADAALHVVIAEMLAGADAMAGRNAKLPAAQDLVQVAAAANAYGDQFDDPGFQPIRHLP